MKHLYSKNTPKGEVHKFYHGNIEQQTLHNKNYRSTPFTGKHSQLVLMSLKPGQSIGNEIHPHVDQFFRIESGRARFTLNNGKLKYIEHNGDALIVPSGHWHNVKNIGKKPLKLYTIYSPSNHPPGTKQKNRPRND
jgi:mannose-6-phosphate isomerase-like protein (cupin superfamily)